MSKIEHECGDYVIVEENEGGKCALWRSLHYRWHQAGIRKMLWPIERFASECSPA